MMQIKINETIFTVQLVKKDSEFLAFDDPNKEILGRTDYLKQNIYIRNDIPFNRRRQTIIHELTHAFIDAYGFSMLEYWNEEQLCMFFEVYSPHIVSLSDKVLNELN